jgi:hypothetical protein
LYECSLYGSVPLEQKETLDNIIEGSTLSEFLLFIAALCGVTPITETLFEYCFASQTKGADISLDFAIYFSTELLQ